LDAQRIAPRNIIWETLPPFLPFAKSIRFEADDQMPKLSDADSWDKVWGLRKKKKKKKKKSC
jgi:hypothetical protein